MFHRLIFFNQIRVLQLYRSIGTYLKDTGAIRSHSLALTEKPKSACKFMQALLIPGENLCNNLSLA